MKEKDERGLMEHVQGDFYLRLNSREKIVAPHLML